MNSNYRPTPLIDSFRLPLSHNDGRLSADGEVSALIFLDSPDEELSERVTHFAKDHGLCAVADAKRQIVKIHGSAAELGYAFNTQLQAHESDGKHYRVRSGHLNVPDEFHEHVVAVLGLDNRPVAKPYLRKMDADASPEARAKALEVSQIARAYDFPQHVTGKGQVIAII